MVLGKFCLSVIVSRPWKCFRTSFPSGDAQHTAGCLNPARRSEPLGWAVFGQIGFRASGWDSQTPEAESLPQAPNHQPLQKQPSPYLDRLLIIFSLLRSPATFLRPVMNVTPTATVGPGGQPVRPSMPASAILIDSSIDNEPSPPCQP
jgi:hypothetical protein